MGVVAPVVLMRLDACVKVVDRRLPSFCLLRQGGRGVQPMSTPHTMLIPRCCGRSGGKHFLLTVFYRDSFLKLQGRSIAFVALQVLVQL
jgi:hypothetical protein